MELDKSFPAHLLYDNTAATTWENVSDFTRRAKDIELHYNLYDIARLMEK